MAITPVQDRTITRQVQSKLMGRGLGVPCRIAVETSKGEVTLSGSVQQAQQKATAVQLTSGISGVRRVIDRLIIKLAIKY
jgi:osmotically-inducible protein OsmY